MASTPSAQRSDSWSCERTAGSVAPTRPYSPPVMPIPANQIPMPGKKAVRVIDAAADSNVQGVGDNGDLSQFPRLPSDEGGPKKQMAKTQTSNFQSERAMLVVEPGSHQSDSTKTTEQDGEGHTEAQHQKIPRLADAAATWDDLGSKITALINARKQASSSKHPSDITGDSSGNVACITPEPGINFSFAVPVTQYSGQPTSYPVPPAVTYDPNQPSYGLPSTAMHHASFSSNFGKAARPNPFFSYYSSQSWPHYPLFEKKNVR